MPVPRPSRTRTLPKAVFLTLAWVWTVAWTWSLSAAAPVAFPPLTDRYILRAWEEDQGLPFLALASLGQTTDGYLWLGTYESVVRFDGLRFEYRSPTEFDERLGSQALCLFADGYDAMWVGTEHGLGRWSPTEPPRIYLEDSGLPPGLVRSIVRDQTGALYASVGNQVCVLEQERWRPIDFLGDGSDEETLVVADAARLLWVRQGARLTHRTEQGLWQVEADRSATNNQTIIGLAVAREGGVWVAYGNRIQRRLPGSWQEGWDRPPGFRGDAVAILEDRQGELWLGAYTQGILHRSRDGTWRQCRSPDGLQNNSITALLEDRHGDVWAASNGGGVHQFRARSFQTYGEAQGSLQSTINVMVELEPGRMAVGTHGGGLVYFAEGRFSPPVALEPPPANPNKWIQALARGSGNSLWVGTHGDGVFQLTPTATNRFSNRDVGNSSIHVILEDRQQRVWIGGNQGLALREGERGSFRKIGPEMGVPLVHSVFGLAEDPSGRIWLSGPTNGPLILGEGNRFEPLPLPPAAAGFKHGPILIDPGGDVWLGDATQPLLLRVQAGTVTVFGDPLGSGDLNLLGVPDIRCLVADLAGNLWLGSGEGIVRIPRTSLKEGSKPQAQWFGKLDGLRTLVCRPFGHPSATRSSDGRVWFGTTKGLSVADPLDLRDPLVATAPIIEELETQGRIIAVPHHQDASIALSATNRNLEVRFTATQLSDPERMEFVYRLNGADRQWKKAPRSRAVQLLNQQPGPHRFEVKSRLLPDPRWSPEVGISYTIAPYWHEQTWIPFVASLFLACSLAGLVWLRMSAWAKRREQERRQEEHMVELRSGKEAAEAASRSKTEFVAMISHELRTPLNGLIGFTELLSNTLLNPQQREYVNTSRLSAEALLSVINDVLDFARLESGQLEFVTELFELRPRLAATIDIVARKAAAKRIDLILDFAPGVPRSLQADPRRLQQILLNLTVNAVKFTERGSVRIRIDFQPTRGSLDLGELSCTIIDTGIGIPESDRPKLFKQFSQADSSDTRRFGGAGLGLAISRLLVERMGGCIDCESAPGEGSRFWFRIPVSTPSDSATSLSRLGFDRVLLIGLDPAQCAAVAGWLGRPLDPTECVLEAADGLEQLRAARLRSKSPILVVAAWAALGDNPEQYAHAWKLACEAHPIRVVLLLRLYDPAVESLAAGWGFDLLWRAPFARLPEPVPEPPTPAFVEPVVSPPLVPSVPIQPLTPATVTAPVPAPLNGSRNGTPKDGSLALPPGWVSTRLPANPAGTPTPPKPKRRALLAEDHPVNQAYAVEVLQGADFEVHVANNGREAVELAAQYTFDIILMDCQMPEMDGWEATRRIRSKEAPGTHVRIVALTAGAFAGDRDRCREVGMDGYLSKPFRIAELRRELERQIPVPDRPAVARP
jgi:signal transduction histidine kinase/ligand-binding sensor domain-containing protein/CheY-like chemotaxis protein